MNLTRKFNRCVKNVRKTLKNEGSAIAICTKSVLFPKGRTLKRYRKTKLTTQKRKRIFKHYNNKI